MRFSLACYADWRNISVIMGSKEQSDIWRRLIDARMECYLATMETYGEKYNAMHEAEIEWERVRAEEKRHM